MPKYLQMNTDIFMGRAKEKFLAEGILGGHAIPEEYLLLRTLQLTICGYSAKPHRNIKNGHKKS